MARRFATTEVISLPAAASLLPSSVLSIVGWFRGTAYATAARHVYSEEMNFDQQIAIRVMTDGKFNWYHRTPGGAGFIVDISSTGSVADGTWHWFLIVRRSATEHEGYIDSTSVFSTTSGTSTTATGTATIGIGNFYGGGPSASADQLSIGRIITIAGTALTVSEAAMLARTGRAARAMTGWWEVLGTATEPDWSGNVRNATAVGGTVTDNPPVVLPFADPGVRPVGGTSILVAGTISRGTITDTSIGMTANAPSGGTTPYTYKWHRSTTQGFSTSGGTELSGQTGLTLSDTTAVQGTVYYYKQVQTDAVPTSVTTNEVAAALADTALKIGFIGDSITIGNPGNGTPATICGQLLQRQFGTRAVTVSNQAISGTATADWLPGAGTGYLTAAKTAFAAAGVTTVLIMLGANDSGASVSAATYGSNLSSICNDLVTAGYTVILNGQGWIAPTSGWPANPNTFLRDYNAQMDSLDNGTTILRGDTEAWTYFVERQSELSDGVHPNTTGAQTYAEMWAAAFARELLDFGPTPAQFASAIWSYATRTLTA
jgi:lysophospholipase L1-like esterase